MRSVPAGIFVDPKQGLMIRFEDHRERKATDAERATMLAALLATLQPRDANVSVRNTLANDLEHAITTMQNDDLSAPMSEKRDRHVARADVMRDVVEFLRSSSVEASSQEVQNACAQVADRFVARDIAWASTHPDDASASSHRAERGRAIAGAIRALIPPTPSGRPVVSIKPMRLSDGRADYFVSIKVGDREVTPHVFREEFKAAYHVALYDWLLNGSGEEPDVVAFGPDDWPARIPAEAPGDAVKAEMLDLAAEFEGEAKAHSAIGDKSERTKCLRAAYALRTVAAMQDVDTISGGAT